MDELDLIFGIDSIGSTLEERARSSKKTFVRSQVQIAPASQNATGRVFSAFEILSTFGWDLLRLAVLEGAAPFISSPNEPAETLRKRREELGLSHERVSSRVGCTADEIARAETEGERTPYRLLERLGAVLALDERLLGMQANPGRDVGLGVRLRELTSHGGDMASFGPATVLGLAESAWVISRQEALSELFGSPKAQLPKYDHNFSYPAYEVGFKLAARARALFDIGDLDPIESVRELIEERLKIPLVQDILNPRFAGATISNGRSRGIVVNERGMNSNVWVRRMTLCHELGHLLWDPDEKLEKVRVDDYSDLDEDIRFSKRDPAEIRANAFAIAFLAPPGAVKKIATIHNEPSAAISEIMQTYGISGSAARHHYVNVTGKKVSISMHNLPNPDGGWFASENLSLDHFPIDSTPISRRGKFSWLVAKLYSVNLISSDTAAFYLSCSPGEIEHQAPKILNLWN